VLATASLISLPTRAALAAADELVPRPEGWIGTTSEWARGLGIGFAVLNLLLLAFAWRRLGRDHAAPVTLQGLFFCLVVLPLSIIFFGYHYGLEASKTVAACGACHVMQPYVDDLRDLKSNTLAAVHYKNQYIQDDQCYACHSDYGMAGTLRAKLEGLGHTWRYSVGSYELPLAIARPYPNTRCLYCHGRAQKFLVSSGHPEKQRPRLLGGSIPCLDCHQPAHPRANR
jgi:nitrate/TMAO reductase-like tetraheme cytochrome c subunit